MKLSFNEIAYLALSFSQNTAISIFANANAQLRGNEKETLRQKDVLSSEGYSPAALRLLNLLARPERCSRLIIRTNLMEIERYLYTANGILILADIPADQEGGEIQFTEIEDIQDAMGPMAALLGNAAMCLSSLNADFTDSELLVLFAIIDIYRKAALQLYISGGYSLPVITTSAIKNELENGFANGLVTLVAEAVDDGAQITELDFGSILWSLAEKGCIVSTSDLSLTDEWLLFAVNFLVMQASAMVEVIQKGDDGVHEKLAATFYYTGMGDVLTLLPEDNGKTVMTMSCYSAAKTVAGMMLAPITADGMIPPERQEGVPSFTVPVYVTQQPALPVQPAPAPQPAPLPHSIPHPVAAQNTWVCTVCGRINTGQFCKNDGTPHPVGNAAAQAQVGGNLCPNCGNAVPDGARFCKKCGTQM